MLVLLERTDCQVKRVSQVVTVFQERMEFLELLDLEVILVLLALLVLQVKVDPVERKGTLVVQVQKVLQDL